MRLNDADAIDQIRNFIALDGHEFILSVEFKESLFMAIRALENHSTGKWISAECFDEIYGQAYDCSICGHGVIGKPHYCPNCGAYMRGDSE